MPPDPPRLHICYDRLHIWIDSCTRKNFPLFSQQSVTGYELLVLLVGSHILASGVDIDNVSDDTSICRVFCFGCLTVRVLITCIVLTHQARRLVARTSSLSDSRYEMMIRYLHSCAIYSSVSCKHRVATHTPTHTFFCTTFKNVK